MNHIYVNGFKCLYFAGILWTRLNIAIACALAFVILAPALFWMVFSL